MRVVKNGYNNSTSAYPKRIKCEKCSSELEYTEPDLRMGEFGCNYIDCPICGKDNMLEDNEFNITLSPYNVEFPTHFYHTVADKAHPDVVDLCNTDEIRARIAEGIDYFNENVDASCWTTRCGNLYLAMFNLPDDEEYVVIVSKDYYETFIPY